MGERAALVEALGIVNYEFKRLKSTAPTGACDIDASGLCWEDSRIYKWKDMIAAVQKMATTGVTRQLYTDGASVKPSPTWRHSSRRRSRRRSSTMRDENNWSDAAVAAGRQHLPGDGGVRQLGQSYGNYQCGATITDESTGQTYDGADVQCAIDPNISGARTTVLVQRPARLRAPTSLIPEAPGDNGGGSSTGTSWNQKDVAPFDTAARGDVLRSIPGDGPRAAGSARDEDRLH